MPAQISLLVLWLLAALVAGEGGVWILGEDAGYHGYYPLVDSGCDTTNVAALSQDRLHVDLFTTVEQLRMVRLPLPLPGVALANRMLNQQTQDEVLVVLHKGHMTILRFGNLTTFSIPAPEPAGLVLVRELACVTMETSAQVLCVNLVEGSVKTCPDLPGSGYRGYSNMATDKYSPDTVFLVSRDSQVILKTTVSENCIQLVGKYSPGPLGAGLWVSHDNSRLFLGNGATLSADTLTREGTLGNYSTGQFTYLSISQLYRTALSRDEPRPISALRVGVADSAFYFLWPSLKQNGSQVIPTPHGYMVQRPISLQYCQPDFLYALVEYKRVSDGQLKTGVAYLKFYT